MGTPVIRTSRLRLVAADARLARAAVAGAAALGEVLDVTVPASWPPPDLADALEFIAAQMEAEEETRRFGGPAPGLAGWGFWYVTVDGHGIGRGGAVGGRESRLLVGGAGFKGPPRADGTVEVGYGIVEDQQRRGYASEAVAGMVRWAFEHPEVARVTAHTFERHEASVGVLRKNGFVVAGAGTERVDENDRRGRGELLLFELRRGDWERSALAPPRGARVVALHHVQITVPRGEEERAREFYCGVLGLREVEKPAALKEGGRGGFWVAVGDRTVHIGVEDGVDRAATKAHVAYAVAELGEWRRRLAAAGVEVKESIRIPGVERFEFRDPFGNRVELVEAV